jgi:hypothetical protein
VPSHRSAVPRRDRPGLPAAGSTRSFGYPRCGTASQEVKPRTAPRANDENERDATGTPRAKRGLRTLADSHLSQYLHHSTMESPDLQKRGRPRGARTHNPRINRKWLSHCFRHARLWPEVPLTSGNAAQRFLPLVAVSRPFADPSRTASRTTPRPSHSWAATRSAWEISYSVRPIRGQDGCARPGALSSP